MSINPILTTPPSLPTLQFQGHGHGHKKGVHGQSDSDAGTSTSAAGSSSPGSTQSLFGSLLDSVEQVIGVKPAAVAAPRTAPKA